MPLHQNDVEAERLVQGSTVFRVVRVAFLAIDRAAASSTARGWWSPSLRSVGIVLLTASVVHAAIITLVPAGTAPAGRYLFAIGTAAVGALLLAGTGRTRGSAR